MKQVLLYAILISVVTTIILLSTGTAIPEEKGLASPAQSQVVPIRRLELTVPAQPPQLTTIYCCNAFECIVVSEFNVCAGTGGLTMVCDTAGVCIPINPMSVRGNNFLFSK